MVCNSCIRLSLFAQNKEVHSLPRINFSGSKRSHITGFEAVYGCLDYPNLLPSDSLFSVSGLNQIKNDDLLVTRIGDVCCILVRSHHANKIVWTLHKKCCMNSAELNTSFDKTNIIHRHAVIFQKYFFKEMWRKMKHLLKYLGRFYLLKWNLQN